MYVVSDKKAWPNFRDSLDQAKQGFKNWDVCAKELHAYIINNFSIIKAEEFQIGKTKVFLKARDSQILSFVIGNPAAKIQRAFRKWMKKKEEVCINFFAQNRIFFPFFFVCVFFCFCISFFKLSSISCFFLSFFLKFFLYTLH